MKISRTKNASKNFIWGIANKLFAILAQFIIRIIILHWLGEAYLGLNGLFTSVLSVLSLTELGVGSALVFNMYRAIAEDDDVKICALMRYYRKCYYIIGCVVLVIGCALFPVIPYIANIDLPNDINIYILYAIYLFGTVVTYFLFAYRNSIVEAYQRNDIISKISLSANVILYGLQLTILLLFQNYYVYVCVIPAINILINVVTAIASKKIFPQYKPVGELSKEIKIDISKKVKALFSYKVGNIVSNSADNIVVSSFLGLVILGKFSNYYYIITTLFALFAIYYNAMTAGIGNSIATESVEKNLHDFDKLSFIQAWLCGFCATCLLCLMQDFMTMWMGKDMLFEFGVVVCFVIYFYFWKIQDVVYIFKDAGGIWEKDRWRPLISATINLALNLALVHFIGVYGILLSTVFCCIAVDLPWGTYVLFKSYFQTSSKSYYLKLVLYTLLNAVVAALTFGICYFIPTSAVWGYRILWFLLKMCICLIVPNLIYIALFHRTQIFKELQHTLMDIIKRHKKQPDNGAEGDNLL